MKAIYQGFLFNVVPDRGSVYSKELKKELPTVKFERPDLEAARLEKKALKAELGKHKAGSEEHTDIVEKLNAVGRNPEYKANYNYKATVEALESDLKLITDIGSFKEELTIEFTQNTGGRHALWYRGAFKVMSARAGSLFPKEGLAYLQGHLLPRVPMRQIKLDDGRVIEAEVLPQTEDDAVMLVEAVLDHKHAYHLSAE